MFVRTALVGLVGLGTLCVYPRNLCAQGCCSPGSPAAGGLEKGGALRGQIRISPLIYFVHMGQTFQGSDEVADEFDREVDAWNAGLDVEYGLTPRVTLLASMNYSMRSRQLISTTSAGTPVNFDADAHGLGDVTLLAKMQLTGWNLKSQREIDVGAGAKLPTGSYDLEEGGVRISRDLLPGSGAYHLILWTYYYKSFRPGPVGVSASAYFDLPATSTDDYRYGAGLNYLIGGLYETQSKADLLLQVNGRWADADQYLGRELPSTGGNWLYARPGVNLRVSPSFSAYVLVDIPLYYDLNGTQLAPSIAFRLGGVLVLGGG
jgi:hypothetical protein